MGPGEFMDLEGSWLSAAGKRPIVQQRHGGKLVRKNRTQENYGWCKELAVTRMRTTGCARVAWHKENFVRKDWARNQAEQETPKPWLDRKRLWKGQEFNDDLREGLKQQPQSKIKVKDSGTRWQLHLGNKKPSRLHMAK
jgi:hypothetical protein